MDNHTQNQVADATEQDDISNLEKLTQSYLLLKQKVCRTHDLIKQYNDKLKECERLKTDLDAMNKQAKKVTCNYNTTLSKVIKLELQNTDYKKNIDTLNAKVAEHEIKVAADKQHIQQLICKIKDVEEQHTEKIMHYDLEKSSLQVKIKELEQELKVAKKSYDTKIKKMEKKLSAGIDTSQTETSAAKPMEKKCTSEIGVNTIPMESKSNEVSLKKREVTEKCTMTNEFYSIKDDIYPLFCAKCETLLDPPPLKKICRMMSTDCPKLIEKISSPSPEKIPLRISNGVRDERCKTENLSNLTNISSSLDLENRQSHDFTNVLSQSPIALNQPNFPADFRPPSEMSNMINRNSYFIGPAMPLSTPNTLNQSNHCVDLTAMASSLSIMNSLQKRIDTLESKMKKRFKQKSVEDSDHCQHKYPTSCYSYDPSSSLPPNLMFELWKRMLDLCDNKQKDVKTSHRCTNAGTIKSNFKKVKLKHKKRLQQGFRNAWDVESIPVKQKPGPVRKKKKLQLFESEPPESVLDHEEDFLSDSDVSFFPRNDPQFEHPRTVETDSPVSNRRTKSVGTETDSGVLSDSVESNKRIQIETEMNTNIIRHSVPMDSESVLAERTNLITTECHKDVDSNNPDSDIGADANEHSESPGVDIRSKVISSTNATVNAVNNIEETVSQQTVISRSRKTNKFGERKKHANREVLLKKIRSLKRNSKVAKLCNGASDATVIPASETLTVMEVQKNVNKEDDSAIEDYIPKKKPRIAHTPKVPTAPARFPRRTIHTTNMESKQSSVLEVQMQKGNEEKVLNGNMETEFHEIGSLDVNFHEPTVPQILKPDKPEVAPGEPDVRISCASETKSVVEECNGVVIPSVEMNNKQPTNEDFLITKESSRPPPRVDLWSNPNSKSSHVENIEIKDASEAMSNMNKNVIENNELSSMDNVIVIKPQVHEVQSNANTSSTLEKLDRKDVKCVDSKDVKNINENEIKGVQEKQMKSMNKKEAEVVSSDVEVTNEVVNSGNLLSRMRQYAMEGKSVNKKNQDKQLARLYKKMDKFVKRQLQRLVNSDWEMTLHNDVLIKLKSTCSPRIIAKCIVEFISTDEKAAQPLDHSHTPPAPLMTCAQQRILTLIIDMQNSIPTIIQLVQAAIEYELFRLNNAVKRSYLDSLTRIYTALARIQKDREKMRIFCCDALYCLGLHAITVLYIVLTSWPEVFPKSDATDELLPRCMAHLVTTQQAATQDFPKLNALKQLIQVFYQYKSDITSRELLKKCLTEVQEKPGTKINTAIVLLAKREGTAWTNKNIIKDELLPMIVQRKFPDTYRAFHLLGNLMRAFPTDDKDNAVGQIVEQLCDLVESGEGSEDQQEGVISALLSLSRHKFQQVSQTVIKWTPEKRLRRRTIVQFEGFLKQRPPEFWKGHLKKNKCLTEYKSARSKT